MTLLTMQDCWDKKWVFSHGKYWALKGTSDTRLKLCMRDAPGLRCPGGECKDVRFDTPVTFSSGHIVRAVDKGGSGLTSYGNIVVTPPAVTSAVSDTVSSSGGVIPVEVLIPNKLGGYTSFKYDVSVPTASGDTPIASTPDVPVIVPSISKTVIMTEMPTSVFKGDTRTMIGAVDVDGAPITGAPVILIIDGNKVDETVTSNGVFIFAYQFNRAGSRKLVFESPSTALYPDYGRYIQRVSVSSVSSELSDRLRAEREDYDARRRALEERRIIIPEYKYIPIFRRHEEFDDTQPGDVIYDTPTDDVTDDVPIAPVKPIVPVVPTRGSIHVELPKGVPDIPIAVWLDDKFSGNAPIEIDNVKIGAHKIVLKAAGFMPLSIPVDVAGDEISYIRGMRMIQTGLVSIAI